MFVAIVFSTCNRFFFFHYSDRDKEKIFYQVFVYSRPKCLTMKKTKVQMESPFNATCDTSVWAPKMSSTATKEQRKTMDSILSRHVTIWQSGDRIDKKKLSNLTSSWSEEAALDQTTKRKLSLTATKRINSLDNHTKFACEVLSEGFEWVGFSTHVCQSEEIVVTEADKWDKDVVIGQFTSLNCESHCPRQ